MRRVPGRWQLALWVPLWAATFGLSLATAFSDTRLSHLTVTSAPDDRSYPVATGTRPFTTMATELRPGDQLLTVGARDLRGMSSMAFQATLLEAEFRGTEPIPVRYLRNGVEGQAVLPSDLFSNLIWPMLPVSLGFALVAFLLLWRAPPSAIVDAHFAGLFSIAMTTGVHFAGNLPLIYASFALTALSHVLVGPLTLLAMQQFPDRRKPASAWARHGPWLTAPLGLLATSTRYGLPLSVPPDLGYTALVAGFLVYFAIAAAVLTRNYRDCDAVGRRRMRWALFGLYASTLGVLAAALGFFLPRFLPGLAAGVIFPVCLLIGILRHNLFDIDRLISATASYNAVVVLLAAVAVAVVPWLADLASEAFGVERSVGQLGVALALAATVVPAQRRLRPKLERWFFAERYALAQGIDALLHELGGGLPPRELLRRAGERLDALLHPEACVLYAHVEDAYAQVFATGTAGPPAFETESALVRVLAERGRPLAAESVARRGAELPPFERAALEMLGVPVVVPVSAHAELYAFLCLGPKRSGDVYTSTDLSLLAAVAEKLAGELSRFDQDRMLEEARSLSERLRRYVPEAVAEELESGADPDAAEREVSILFVDLRDDSRYAESHGPEEVFSTLNRYAETASALVERHGGHVVEFSGDGLLAVFGAPRALEAKEQAAVEAGCAIPRAVEGLRGSGETALAVAVGIATGPAFVGSIRAADRLIWSAVGHTTNLATRLQSLARELDAQVVIDATTWESCGDHAAAFECRAGIEIRGRSDPHDLYVVPIEQRHAPAPSGGAERRAEDWTGRVLAGRYRVESRLGEGGMATAYRARDRRLDRDVVVKVPRPELLLQPGYRERFALEVRHLIQLEHPHVVKIHDAGEDDRVPYAVVQYLRGGDLRERLDRSGCLRPDEIPTWLTPIADALDHLHAADLVHRDVKPDNLLFDERGHAFLSDFGITTAASDGTDAHVADLTGTGLVLGAARYSAPESGERAFAPAYDQYALGVVVYEALSGEQPFDAEHPLDLLLAKRQEEPVPLSERVPELPPPLSEAVMRALARDPGARFPSCGQFALACATAADA